MSMHSKIGPTFLKETSDLRRFENGLKELLDLSKKSKSNIACKIQDELTKARMGSYGEDNIIYYLKNSDIDMIILQDINLKYGELKAQIDFLIITRKKIYVLECKNLYGNIEIDSNNNWIRTSSRDSKDYREGIESPITQNDHHLNIIKLIREDTKHTDKEKDEYEKFFNDNYKSLVVLANDRTILDIDPNANKDISNIVIKGDQLINKIKELDSEEHKINRTNDEMHKIASIFLEINDPSISSINIKFKSLLEEFKEIRTYELTKLEQRTTQRCPECDGFLKIKPVHNGFNKGHYILGCSNYPSCKYLINL